MKWLKENSFFLHEVYHVFFAYAFAIHPDSLPEVHQVGRGVESHFIALRLQNGSQRVGARTLAVGACHVDCAVAKMGMAEVFV